MGGTINLSEAIKSIRLSIDSLEREREQRIKETKKEYDAKIAKFRNALEVLGKLNEVCVNCDGRGWYKTLDASGNWDREQCEACGGSGKVANR